MKQLEGQQAKKNVLQMQRCINLQKLDLQTISQCLNVNENNDLVNKTLKDSKAENQCWMCVIVRPSRSTALTADTIVCWKLVHALRNASRNQPPSTHAG